MTTPLRPISRFALARQQARARLDHAIERGAETMARAGSASLTHAAVGSLGALTAVGILSSGGRADLPGVSMLGLVAGIAYASRRATADQRHQGEAPPLLRSAGRAALATALAMNAATVTATAVAGEPKTASFQTSDHIRITVVRDEQQTPGRPFAVSIQAPTGPEGTAQQLVVIQDAPGEIGLALPTGEVVRLQREADGTVTLRQAPPRSGPAAQATPDAAPRPQAPAPAAIALR